MLIWQLLLPSIRVPTQHRVIVWQRANVGRRSHLHDPDQALEPPNQDIRLISRNDQSLNVLHRSANNLVVLQGTAIIDCLHVPISWMTDETDIRTSTRGLVMEALIIPAHSMALVNLGAMAVLVIVIVNLQ